MLLHHALQSSIMTSRRSMLFIHVYVNHQYRIAAYAWIRQTALALSVISAETKDYANMNMTYIHLHVNVYTCKCIYMYIVFAFLYGLDTILYKFFVTNSIATNNNIMSLLN